MTDDSLPARLAPHVLSILRIMAALLFLEHGLSRLFGFPSPLPTPPVFTLYWFAGAIELAGGVLLTLGLFSRLAALVMSGEMAFAYFLSHAPHGFFPILNRGDGGGPVLLRVSLHRLRRTGAVEPRRADGRRARAQRRRAAGAVSSAAAEADCPQPGYVHRHRPARRGIVRRHDGRNVQGDPMSQRVLITAGAAGIGREMARAFAATGAKVFTCDIDDKGLDALAKEIPGLTARRCDMSSRAEIERMVPAAHRRARRARCARQQCRYRRPDAAGRPVSRRRLGQGRRRQPHGDVRRLPARHPGAEAVEGRRDRQPVVGRRALRLRQSQSLRGDEMGRDRPDQDARDRARRNGASAPTPSRPARSRATASSASSRAAPRSAASRWRR